MVIIILRRTGVNDMEPVARWEDGTWVDGDPDEYRFIGSGDFEQYTDELMLDHFNGPDFFAIDEDDYTGKA